eukprot:XP_001689678.1 predicted protein [Chlamydomonas reinhardtii]
MPRVPAAKPAVSAVTLVRGGAAKAHGKPAPPARTVLVAPEQPPAPPSRSEFEKETCPLCVEDLDETDMSFQPCPCGYRMCLFCFEKLKLHCSSVCPNCRRGFGSDEAREYAKQLEAERVQEAMRPKPTAPAPAASTSAASAVASRAAAKPVPAAARRDAPPLPAAKRGSTALEDPSGAGPGLPSGVTWANASPTSGLSRNQSVATTVNGMRRAVNVPLSLGASSVEPYPEAPALLASMQQGVAQGTVSSKEAASQLMALLQQKNQDQAAARRPVTKPPPGFSAPAQPAAAAQTQATVAAQGAPLVAARPPPPPGFTHLQGTVVQAPAVTRAPIQPPQQTDASAFGSAAGPIGLNANGTPRTYSMWSGLPGMDLSASTGLSSLWQNLNATALGGMGGATQPYNPLGMMGSDQSGLAYGGVRAPMAGAPPKAPPPGFGPAAFGGAPAATGTAQQAAGGANAVLGLAANPYRYNPLGQAMSGAYRPPQLGAGL